MIKIKAKNVESILELMYILRPHINCNIVCKNYEQVCQVINKLADGLDHIQILFEHPVFTIYNRDDSRVWVTPTDHQDTGDDVVKFYMV